MHYRDIDIFIGQQLKSLRLTLGISQQALAREAGISTQQIQKYEKALNRISASRLYDFAHIFQVSILTFFPQDFEQPAGLISPPSLRFIRMFGSIPVEHHAQLFLLLKAMAKLPNGGTHAD